MNEFQRKIELQSSDDLQFLVSNIRRAARSKIDEDLPPLEKEDAIRKHVEREVSQYIKDVVKNISKNISINGLEPSESKVDAILDLKLDAMTTATTTASEIEEYEPFNTHLFQQAQKLAQEEEDLIEEIAMLRRTMPAKIVKSVKTEFKEGLEADEATLTTALKEYVECSVDVTPTILNITALESQETMEKDWNKSVQVLGSLMRLIPEMVAKKVRTEEVEKYLCPNKIS
ncbi:putative kinetochore protein [Erysiphe necator]|uniref:Putative kinetochore protein n=1 Tax=Uncinula necator TaxID=52586 RepID=A0A0B1NYU3_UNCNE|nr:putative kinetochore protein [Erysiphe necator]